MMDKELIKKARQANISEYLLNVGIPLVKSRGRYRHKEHDSLVFTENAYYWNSQQEHGNAIDYLVRHMNMSFKDAVSALVPVSEQKPMQLITNDTVFEIDKTTLSNNNEKIYTYLHDTRFISNNMINYLFTKKLLFLEKQTNNAFFLMHDENNNCVGAEIQGTSKKRFKGIKANSKYGYGFNVRFSDNNTFDYALFFESAIDLISFIDYKLDHENKSLEKCILISMAGLKMNVVKHSLEVFKGAFGAPDIVLCVDNDSAGEEFINEVEKAKIKYIDRTPDKKYKDWNEQLIDVKRRSKPITRLMNRGFARNRDLTEQTQYETKIQKDRNGR